MRKIPSVFRVVAAALLLSLGACATYEAVKDIEVRTEAVPTVNFSKYKSYAWLGGAAIVFDEEGRWEPPAFDADMEIKFLIDEQLRARGMVENSANPDLAVGFSVGVNMDAMELDTAGEETLETLKNAPKSALMVVLVDVKTRKAVWVGAATGGASEKPDVERTKTRLRYAVESMMKELPR